MKHVVVFNTKFEVVTPQKFMGRIVNIQGSAGDKHANFFFLHPTEGRVEVAYFDVETNELKEQIYGIVKVLK